MVTKGYRKGVYERVTKGTQGRALSGEDKVRSRRIDQPPFSLRTVPLDLSLERQRLGSPDISDRWLNRSQNSF